MEFWLDFRILSATYSMALESFSSSMTADMTGINGGNPRRNSLAGSTNTRERAPSLYRRASIGTYHDFCKPGKEHDEPEEKVRLPFPKRIIKKPSDEPSLFGSSDSPQRKKTTPIRTRSLPSKVTELRTSTDLPDGNKPIVKEKASVAKLKSKYAPNSGSHSCDTSDVINPEVPTNSSNKNKFSTKLKSDLSDAGKVMPQDGSSRSGRVQVPSKKVPSKANEESLLKRPATSSKPKARAEKLLPAVPSDVISARRQGGTGDTKKGKTTATSKVTLEDLSASRRAPLSRRASLSGKNRNLKVVLPQKSRNELENDKTEQQILDEHVGSNTDTINEKTLYVIKLETENVMLESDKNENCAAEVSPNVQDEPESTATEAKHDSDSAFNNAVHMEETDTSDDSQPVRLSFRRGTIIDIEPDDHCPMQLKFRQGSVECDTNDGPIDEKVVLRHHDVPGKQDGQGLFNNIIEEAVNKLVGARKSKVKALVGAFETVINLQDTKPSSNGV
ncbi:uncharacterized protein LOC120203288 [Hibiscus syriacus]|uniref:uncharacterized protein LOC120203288 n=1 Tax=Hibiscus syriacus TaxID=106335 RepID=UPI0019220C93|nr:uncharacterized protein LOC120203288 [Hibiscus syriacus]